MSGSRDNTGITIFLGIVLIFSSSCNPPVENVSTKNRDSVTIKTESGKELTSVKDTIEIPDFSQWNASPGVTIKKQDNNLFLVEGDKTVYGYQIQTNPIPVKSNADVQISILLQRKQGNFGIGILNSTGSNFLINPSESLITGDQLERKVIKLNTQNNDKIAIVIANSNDNSQESKPSIFIVGK